MLVSVAAVVAVAAAAAQRTCLGGRHGRRQAECRENRAQPVRDQATTGGGNQHEAESTGHRPERAGSKAAGVDLVELPTW